jgi:two-component system sensor histidine kinase AlgZ
MPEARSINQNKQPNALPNFRSLGVILRTVLMVNGIALLAIFADAVSLSDVQQHLVKVSAIMQPVLLTSLLLLYLFNEVLAHMRYWNGVMLAAVIPAVTAATVNHLGAGLFISENSYDPFLSWRYAVISFAIAMLLLNYFRLRTLALSPAMQRAQFQALQARIRPHFLFNTINAVLSVVRTQPKQAETALEDMADLFRAAMADDRELVSLSKEIELSRQYLALEKMRLGERLSTEWSTPDLPADALIPPLILQPLLENAVYHGIEPLPQGGCIDIRIYLDGKELHLVVRNPASEQTAGRTAGNKMALSNIRERLELIFDLESRYKVVIDQHYYTVDILMPYVKELEL